MRRLVLLASLIIFSTAEDPIVNDNVPDVGQPGMWAFVSTEVKKINVKSHVLSKNGALSNMRVSNYWARRKILRQACKIPSAIVQDKR